jgi:hypothetical protein
MFYHHLQQLLSHCSVAGQYLSSSFHAGGRALILSLSRTEEPRDAMRIALRQVGPAARVRRRSRVLPPLLIHYHIFKNAGTSFEWALQEAFGKGMKCVDKPDRDGFVSNRDIAKIVRQHPYLKAISSHQAAPSAPAIRGRSLLTSILIRDPIARVRSIYAFERKQTGRGIGAVKAKELDFKGYVEWRLQATPRMFCDFQFHFLRRYSSRHDPLLNETELRQSIATLDAIDIVGTVERYDEWIGLAESILSRQFGPLTLPIVRLNAQEANPPKSQTQIFQDLVADLGLNLAQQLLEKNEFDMRLYQIADALLSRKLAEEGAQVGLRSAYGEAYRAPSTSQNIV